MLDDLIKQASCVTYSPLPDEPSLTFLRRGTHTVPSDRHTDPLEEMEKIRGLVDDVVIFVPGTRFDAHGTRHGRGGGWYDRFLSHAPHQWSRVGVCFEKQFSDSPLIRASWDEPMDYVLIVGTTGPLRLITTQAR